MHDATNDELALVARLAAIRETPLTVHRLGRSREKGISGLRAYMGRRYYTFADGRWLFLVLGPEDEALHLPALGLRLGAPEVRGRGLRVPVHGPDDVEVLRAELTFGEPPARMPVRVVAAGLEIDPVIQPGAPLRGSVARVLLAARRFDQELEVGLELPHGEVAPGLRGLGLGVRRAPSGGAYVFRDDPSPARIEDMVRAVQAGALPDRFVDVVGTADLAAGPAVREAEVGGVPLLEVDLRGYRHVILDRPRRLARLGRDRAVEIAEGLSMDSAGRSRRAAVGQARAAARRSAADAAFRSSVRVLGLDAYERVEHRWQQARAQQTPFDSYAREVDGSVAIPGTVLLEGYHGHSFSGSLLALAQVWPQARPGVRLHVVVRDPERWTAKAARYGVDVELVPWQSRRHFDLLRTAAIVVTDATLPRSFVVAEGQTTASLWHGSSLRRRGLDRGSDPRDLANVQRTLLLADVAAASSVPQARMLASAFLADPDRLALLPSPRNSLLLSPGGAGRLRAELGIAADERVVLWRPRIRGGPGQSLDLRTSVAQAERMAGIRSGLRRPVRFLARVDPTVAARAGLEERGIEVVPPWVDAYEAAAAADLLVTDTSSMLFDFALRGRPIVLDLADEGRDGYYLDPDALPVAVAHSEEQVREAIDSAPDEVDLGELVAAHAPLDGVDGARQVVQHLEAAAERVRDGRPAAPAVDPRPRVLLVPGSMAPNGITSSFLNLLPTLDDRRRYEVLLPVKSLAPGSTGNVRTVIDSGVPVVLAPKGLVLAPDEKLVWRRFARRLPVSSGQWPILERVFQREGRRLLGRTGYDQVVHFSGYDALWAGIAGTMPTTSHVFVHSDMAAELRLRNNFNEQVIRFAHRRAASIAVVSEGLVEPTVRYLGDPRLQEKIRVVHNVIDVSAVRARSLQREPALTPAQEAALDDPATVCLVTVGRFSPEKGQDRLLAAFEAVADERADLVLFLIGGRGVAAESLRRAVAGSRHGAAIHILEDINPMPIIRRCDLFVLPSRYEGFGMVLLEAIALGVPVLSTDIPGPRQFLERGYGHTCPDSVDGLAVGIRAFLAGGFGPPPDLEPYVRTARREFEELLARAEAAPPGQAAPLG